MSEDTRPTKHATEITLHLCLTGIKLPFTWMSDYIWKEYNWDDNICVKMTIMFYNTTYNTTNNTVLVHTYIQTYIMHVLIYHNVCTMVMGLASKVTLTNSKMKDWMEKHGQTCFGNVMATLISKHVFQSCICSNSYTSFQL